MGLTRVNRIPQHTMSRKTKLSNSEPDTGELLGQLRELIQQARQQALRAVDLVQVRTCWTVGQHIVEFEQGGQTRAEYGTGLLAQVAVKLTADFGKGFDASNLYKMTQFYRQFPNLDAVSLNLSWTHYRLLLRLDDPLARDWYAREATGQNWSTRQLERQIGTLYYERLLASKDRKGVLREAQKNLAATDETPRDFVRDPVMLEFLGLPGSGRLLESKLEDALIGNLQAFCLNSARGSPSWRASSASAPRAKISTSTWCSTTTCSIALFSSI